MTATLAPSDSPAVDVDALLAGVAELERAQRAEDVDGFLALLDADAVWVTGGGGRLVGWEAIAASPGKCFPARSRTGRCATTWSTSGSSRRTWRSPASRRSTSRPPVSRSSCASRDSRATSGTGMRAAGSSAAGRRRACRCPRRRPSGRRMSAAIRAIVADVEAGFNDNDADLLLRHVAEDALIVNAVGHVLRGGDAIEASRAPVSPARCATRERTTG